MGYSSLMKFRTRLQGRLGDRDLSESFLNAAINDGYFDLTGATDFEELHVTSRIDLDAEEIDVLLPQDLQWLRSVFNDTDQKAIVRVDENFFWTLKEKEDGGEPIHYTRIGDSLRIWPALDETYTFRINYNRFPTALSEDSDTTVLPPTWDRAVDMLATYHALLEVGEESRAADWANKAAFYIRTRQMESDVHGGAHLGVRVVTTLDELRSLGG